VKNHFARAGIAPDTDDETLVRKLAARPPEVDAELAADLTAAGTVLAPPERRVHYRRVHLQYQALAVALDALDDPIATDSHRWRERLVEFDEGQSS